MSNAYRQTRIKCSNDCVQTGCPGHDMVLGHHHTSDTVSIYMDGKHYSTFDKSIWKRLVLMENEFDNWQHSMFVEATQHPWIRK